MARRAPGRLWKRLTRDKKSEYRLVGLSLQPGQHCGNGKGVRAAAGSRGAGDEQDSGPQQARPHTPLVMRGTRQAESGVCLCAAWHSCVEASRQAALSFADAVGTSYEAWPREDHWIRP